MNPKISDFGMARIFDVDQSKANTRRIVSTYGYMPPEYAMRGQFSDKSDTYSFGMLVLEIISGKKNSSYYQEHGAVNIVSYVWKHWKKNTALEVMDPTLSNSCSRDEVVRCLHIGLLCGQKDAARRPTMTTVVLMLETGHSTSSLPLPQEPAFLFHSKMEDSFPAEISCRINLEQDRQRYQSTRRQLLNHIPDSWNNISVHALSLLNSLHLNLVAIRCANC